MQNRIKNIQRIQEKDLQDIVDFFNKVYRDRSKESVDLRLLKWLFSNPNNPYDYNGFVARDVNDNVVGTIGFSLNKYAINDRILTGVIPNSWLVSPAERGFLGVQLLRKAMMFGDFTFAIGGTREGTKVYEALKFDLIGSAFVYSKIFRFGKFIRYGKSSYLKDFFKSLLFYRAKMKLYRPNKLTLELAHSFNCSTIPSENTLTIIPTIERAKWIMKCPKIEPLLLDIKLENNKIGSCICYIGVDSDKIKRGRIVYISHLGEEVENYQGVISLVELYLYNLGCCSLTVLSMNPLHGKALKLQGYRHFPKFMNQVNVYVKDPNNCIDSKESIAYNFSYFEGDKAYLFI